MIAAVCACLIGAGTSSLGAEPGGGNSPLITKHLVEIGAGRRLNMVCTGNGSPTVVFEYGLGGHLLNWKRVQPAISALTTTCFYDRAGYGSSDPSGRPPTAQNATDDLYWLLKKSGVQMPIVLVAHSLGGLYATLYTDRFPSQISALVLVDPIFAGEDLTETLEEQARAQAAFERSQAWMSGCRQRARDRLLSPQNPAGCIPLLPNQTAAERDWLAAQFSDPGRWDTMLGESRNVHAPHALSEDEKEEQAAARSFADMPLIVLTAGIIPAQPGEPPAEHEKSVARWKAGHDRLAARSSRGQSILVPNATHMIPLDEPQAVIDAIKRVVVEIREKNQKARRSGDFGQ